MSCLLSPSGLMCYLWLVFSLLVSCQDHLSMGESELLTSVLSYIAACFSL